MRQDIFFYQSETKGRLTNDDARRILIDPQLGNEYKPNIENN